MFPADAEIITLVGCPFQLRRPCSTSGAGVLQLMQRVRQNHTYSMHHTYVQSSRQSSCTTSWPSSRRITMSALTRDSGLYLSPRHIFRLVKVPSLQVCLASEHAIACR